MKEMCERFDKQNKSFFGRLMEMKEQFNTLYDRVTLRLDASAKLMEHLKSSARARDEQVRHLEFYLDKVLPAKTIS